MVFGETLISPVASWFIACAYAAFRLLKRVFLIPDHARPIFKVVSIRHIKEVKMPSPRKAPPSHAAETDMPSRKKEVAAPSKSLAKTQGQKGAQVAQRTKGKSKG